MASMSDLNNPLTGGGNGENAGEGRDNGITAKLIAIALGIGSITAAVCTFTGKLPWDPEEKDQGWNVFAWKVFFVVFIPLIVVLPYLIYHLYRSYCTTAATASTPQVTDPENPGETPSANETNTAGET